MTDQESTFRYKFGQNLKRLRLTRKKTQENLAGFVGVSNKTLSSWEHGTTLPGVREIADLANTLNIDPQELLDVDSSLVIGEEIGIKWRENPPLFNNAVSQHAESILENDLRKGRQLFNMHVRDHYSLKELGAREPFAGLSDGQLRRYLNLVLLTGTIRLVNVDNDEETAKKVKVAFQDRLKQCFVAKVHHNHSGAIRTEAVSYMAVKYLIDLLPNPGLVGLSGGTTISRFVDLVPPALPTIAGINWVSLLGTSEKDTTAALSANSVVSRMVYKQPDTRGYHLPYLPPSLRGPIPQDVTESERHFIQSSKAIFDLGRTVSVAILSVGSYDHERRPTEDYLGYSVINSVRDNLAPANISQCVGDILLQLVDANGERVGSVENNAENDATVYTMGIDGLRYTIENGGTVWILASRRHKARVIKGAILGGLANALIVDSTVADELLHLMSTKHRNRSR